MAKETWMRLPIKLLEKQFKRAQEIFQRARQRDPRLELVRSLSVSHPLGWRALIGLIDERTEACLLAAEQTTSSYLVRDSFLGGATELRKLRRFLDSITLLIEEQTSEAAPQLADTSSEVEEGEVSE